MLDQPQFEQLIEKAELDSIHNWETITVLDLVNRYHNWTNYLSMAGFEEEDLKDLPLEEEAFPVLDLDSEEKWIQFAKWLKEVVFGELNLSILKVAEAWHGDEGGTGGYICLIKQDDYDHHQSMEPGDDDWGDNYPEWVMFKMGKEIEKKYYIFTTVI